MGVAPDDDEHRARLKKIALSAGIPGAAMGAASAFLNMGPAWRLKRMLAAAGAGGAGMAGLAVGANEVGESLMGKPKHQEANPYTRRGGVGGALIGGGLGLAGGGALASGALEKYAPKVQQKFRDMLTRETDLGMREAKNPLSAWLLKPGSPRKAALGAGAGMAALGLLGAAKGADEGMMVDVIEQERRAKHDKQMARALAKKARQEMRNGS